LVALCRFSENNIILLLVVDTYKLEKCVWTECDFEIMGWHDSHVYAIAFSPEKFEIIFDIDYIFEWIHPKPDEKYFSFWVSPATLIFENSYDIELHIESYNGGLEIDSIKREHVGMPINAQFIGKDKEWIWTIECQEGEIKFRSSGYKQYVRAEPRLGGQTLDLEKRETSFQRRLID
jgi:hypothetical protein